MLKKSLVTLALAALVVGGGGLPAHADTPGCVSKSEFKKVGKGMKIGKVHKKFDTAGKQSYFFGATQFSNAMQLREYKACGSSYGFVMIDFEKKGGAWKVTGKNAFWG